MNSIQPLTWRKGIVLSATFLLSVFLVVSCKKKVNPIGSNTIDQNEIMQSGGVDTFSLETYSYYDDSVISDNMPFAILGSYEDPVFGNFNSEIYTQFRLEGVNPYFGVLANITIDSFILSLDYVSNYGNPGDQIVEVYEITEDMFLDSTYYSFDTLSTNGTNLVVPGTELMNFNTQNVTFVGGEEVDPQLRIQLLTSKAEEFMIEAESGSSTFSTNEEFLTYFKGLKVMTNNPPQSSGEGGAFYFNMTDVDTKLTIYYSEVTKDETLHKSFDFLINSSCADFNHVDIAQSSLVQSVIDVPVNGQQEYYTQAYGSRAVVKIPGLSYIPPNAVIHKAVLELPIQYHTGTDYAPGLEVSVSTILEEGSTDLVSNGTIGHYSDYTKSFEIDMRAYAQAIVNGDLNNTHFVIILNGSETLNKAQPKLYILYTEF
jgi:Domain of unknown function (DUF4270)